MATPKKIVALCLFLMVSFFASVAWGQSYGGTYSATRTDITSYCTSGTNCWRLMGNGASVMDADAGGDGQTIMINTSGTVYVWNYNTHLWYDAGLSSIFTKVAVQDQYHVYLLGSGGSCTAPAKAFYFWDGVHNPSLAGTKCFTSIFVSKYGPQLLEAIDSHSGTWDSTDGGSNWSPDPNTAGMTFMYMNDNTNWCNTKAGALQTYQSGNGKGILPFSPAPTGYMLGCIFGTTTFTGASSSYTGGNYLIAWNNLGVVQTYDFVKGTWSVISNITATKVVGAGKANIMGVSYNYPYHYNVVPVSMSLTMSGSWGIYCPVAPSVCPQGAKHKVTAHIYYPHDLQGQIASQEGTPSDFISATSTALSAKCDLDFAGPNDPECKVTLDPTVANNEGLCEVSNATLGTPPPIPTWAGSQDVVSANGTVAAWWSAPIGPGGFIVTTVCETYNTCKPPTVATCPNVTASVEELCGGLSCDPITMEAEAAAKCKWGEAPNAWSIITPYLKDGSGKLIPGTCVYTASTDALLIPESAYQIPCD